MEEKDDTTLSPSDRMKKVLSELGLTNEQLAEKIGLRRADAIRNILRGDNGISQNIAYRITQQFPRFRAEWLRYGEGRIRLDYCMICVFAP